MLKRVILATLPIFAISMLSSAHAAVDITPPAEAGAQEASEKVSKLKPAELPPAIQQLLKAPVKPMEELAKSGRVDVTGRPEVLVLGERAGFKRYYQEGRGFKATENLSFSGRVEMFQESPPIDSLIIAANEQRIRGLNRLEREDTLVDDEIRNSYTKATAGTAIMKLKNEWPVLRFTYDWRELNRVYDETLNGFEELRQETYEHFIEYAIPYKLPFLGDWSINAGYSRILLRSRQNLNANEQRNKWTFNNAFRIDKEREIFFQYEYFVGKHEDAPFILKPDQHTFVFQWRQRLPDWRLFSVTNYSVSRELFNPDVALFAKHEIFQEFNKDITEKLRATQRTTFIYDKVANSNFNPDKVFADAIIGKLKLSYEIIQHLDISMQYQNSWGLNLTNYDSAQFLWETEFFMPGLVRTSFGVYWQPYYNASKDVRGFQWRFFLFQ